MAKRLMAAAVALAVFLPDVATSQSVTIVRRDSLTRGDSTTVTLLRALSTEELFVMARKLREQEAQLLNALRMVPPEGADAERRLFNELGDVARRQFALMSVAESRCHREAGPQPDGYIGVNLNSAVDSVTGAIRHTVIESVEPGSPAERAGLLSGDTLYSIGGRDFRRRLPDASGLLQPGKRVAVRVGRAGRNREMIVTVAPRPQTFTNGCVEFERFLTPPRISAWRATTEPRVLRDNGPTREPQVVRFSILGPDHVASSVSPFFAGAQFRELDRDWRRVLGVPDGQDGVLVNAVAEGSAAAQSGLKNGDVVMAVGGTSAHSPMSLVQLLSLAERSGRSEAALRVLRARDTTVVTLRWGPGPKP